MADTEDTGKLISRLRKRRGVTRGSITRLLSRVDELEATRDLPTTPDHAQHLISKVESTDNDFRTHHFGIIDLIDADDEEALLNEQDVLDKHEDKISDIFLCLQALIAEVTPLSNECKMLALKLSHLEKNIDATHTEIDGIPPDHDVFTFGVCL